jgi:Family of unknown function (DUF6152)
MRMKMKSRVFMAAIGFLFVAVPLIAHHGFDTEYDANKKVKLTGVVTKVEWLNPHMRVYIDVTDANGTVSNWNLELTSPNTVRRQGWGPRDLLAGEKVIFEAYAGKVIETRGALARISKAETPDKPLFVAGGPEQPGFPKQ